MTLDELNTILKQPDVANKMRLWRRETIRAFAKGVRILKLRGVPEELAIEWVNATVDAALLEDWLIEGERNGRNRRGHKRRVRCEDSGGSNPVGSPETDQSGDPGDPE